MQREIEFRYWDNVIKMMACSGEWAIMDPLNRLSSFFQQASRCAHEGIIQQFTGLLDQNGKKIFEGDIVECSFNMWQDKKNHGVVEFCKKYGSMGVLITDAEIHVNTQHIPKPFFNFITNSGDLLITVVGNIFENPELLS